MPHTIIREPGVGYWTTEADYDRRLNAHRKMKMWWAATLIVWGLQNGKITRTTQKETNLQ